VLKPPTVDQGIAGLIELAIAEDLGGAGDRSAKTAIPDSLQGIGCIVARSGGVIAGTFLVPEILRHYSTSLNWTARVNDSQTIAPNGIVGEIAGPAAPLLSAERVVLNFLSHLSGIATLTSRYVALVRQVGAKTQVCDTRKTTPGWRILEKYAVRCGGGSNHRMGLYDGVMLKDNHLAALRNRLGKNLSLAQLTAEVRSKLPSEIPLWLEVDTLDQLAEALLNGGADIILLDNMTPEQVTRAVEMRNRHHSSGRPLLEASGGITLDNLAAFAAAGVDRVSIGALTHSAPILDLSMEFKNF